MINKIMKPKSKFKKILFNKDYRFIILANLGFYNKMSDEEYIKKMFKAKMGYKLNLTNPNSFNEKLQWLKIHDRKKLYTMLVDKVEVKKIIAEKYGSNYIIPTIGIWNNPDEINFDELPDQFVLKCNHNSGKGMCICSDKSKLDEKKVKKELWKGFKEDYFLIGREWPYKDVKHKILGEKFMVDEEYQELIDYKIYAFNGTCDYVMVCMGRFKGDVKFYYFDRDWNLIKNFSNDGLIINQSIPINRPYNLKKMFDIASELSKDIPFVRVDFYEVNKKLYFGELTFYPSSGWDNERTDQISDYLNQSLLLGHL